VSTLRGVTLSEGPAPGQQGPGEAGVHADGGQSPAVRTHSEAGCLLVRTSGWLVEKGREVGREAPFPFSFAAGPPLVCAALGFGPRGVKGQGFHILQCVGLCTL